LLTLSQRPFKEQNRGKGGEGVLERSVDYSATIFTVILSALMRRKRRKEG
jgi:hypothetical protein